MTALLKVVLVKSPKEAEERLNARCDVALLLVGDAPQDVAVYCRDLRVARIVAQVVPEAIAYTRVADTSILVKKVYNLGPSGAEEIWCKLRV